MSSRTESTADRTPQEGRRNLGILVGYDGSESADCALEWAADEAKRSGRPLTVVSAYTIPSYSPAGMDAAVIIPEEGGIREGAQSIADHGRDIALRCGVEATSLAAFGDATGVLRDLSAEADLLVIGARGRGGFMGLLVGSTASSVPGHAKCASVIVPKPSKHSRPAEDREQAVAVGVDGSERGRVAALVAAERAQSLGLPLRLVCALPPITGSMSWLPPAEAVDTVKEEIEVQIAAARQWLLSYFPALTIETRLADGTAPQVLTEMSESVRLTVVGARGGGGFLGMLLGSTSQAVLSQARGPVMVVPENDDDPRLATRAEFGTGTIPRL